MQNPSVNNPESTESAQDNVELSNSEKLEQQVKGDAEFWLPLVKSENFTWVKESVRDKIQLATTLGNYGLPFLY